MPAVKHVSLRTCVACGKIKPQREMLRVSNSPEGVELDPGTKKRSGRGAYICREEDCRRKHLNWDRMEKALRISLNPEDKNRLALQLKEFCGGEGK